MTAPPDLDPAPPAVPPLRGTNAADRAVNLALDLGELWHSPDGRAWLTTEVEGRREHFRVESKPFRQYLAAMYYRSSGGTVNANALRQAVDTLAGMAVADGPEYEPAVRVAQFGGVTFLDLANSGRDVVVVSGGTWYVAGGGYGLPEQVRFQRTDRLAPLPEPVSGGALEDLRDFVNVDDEGFTLVRSWLLSTLRSEPPYPLLAFMGEQRVGKTTAARAAAGIVDPQTMGEGSEPKDVRNVLLAAKHGRVLFLGNLTRVDGELSDMLCRIATGGGNSARTLYTDEEETIIQLARPVVLTGIGQYISRPDLMDRTLVVEPEPFDPGRRLPERELWGRWERKRPELLGAALTAVAGATATPPPKLDREQADRVRMLDVAEWVSAAEQAAPEAVGAGPPFLEVAGTAAERQSSSLVESHPLYLALARLLASREDRAWEGTTTELWETLEQRGGVTGSRSWTARSLGRQLQQLAADLRRAGWEVSRSRSKAGVRWRLVAPEGVDGRRPAAPL